MRRSTTIILLAALAVAGWWTAWKTWTALTQAEARLAAAQLATQSAGRAHAQTKVQLRLVQTELAAAKAEGSTRKSASVAANPAATRPENPALEARPDYFRRVVEDPEVNTLFVAQQKLQLTQKYWFLLKKLHLTPAQEEAFLQRLIEKRVTSMDLANVAQANGLRPNDDAIIKGFDQANADTDNAIRALLGDERFAQYRDFDQNIAAWNGLYGISRDIAVASSPLDAVQAEALTKIMASSSDFRWPREGASRAELQAAVTKYTEMTDTALRDASAVLTPGQLAALNSYLSRSLISAKMKAAFQPSPSGNP